MEKSLRTGLDARSLGTEEVPTDAGIAKSGLLACHAYIGTLGCMGRVVLVVTYDGLTAVGANIHNSEVSEGAA